MKPTLFLSDEPETVKLMLEEVTSGGSALREREAHVECNCDRWGHPCAGCHNGRKQNKTDAPTSSAKQRGK